MHMFAHKKVGCHQKIKIDSTLGITGYATSNKTNEKDTTGLKTQLKTRNKKTVSF